jgi:hypothetical protein
MEGHELPQHEPVTVHFTYQFGDTNAYPHGKRQRAREAALWAVDPPEYFTEGVYVAIVGPSYTAEQQAAVYRRFPEWSPQRHMFMDAPQRQAVRSDRRRLASPATRAHPGCSPVASRLQPHAESSRPQPFELHAAAPCTPGCNPMCARLQPHVRQAATPCAPGA